MLDRSRIKQDNIIMRVKKHVPFQPKCCKFCKAVMIGDDLLPLAHNLITSPAGHRWSSNPCFPAATVPEEVLKMVIAFLPNTEAITQKAVLYGSE